MNIFVQFSDSTETESLPLSDPRKTLPFGRIREASTDRSPVEGVCRQISSRHDLWL
jgi:hypothetical protein